MAAIQHAFVYPSPRGYYNDADQQDTWPNKTRDEKKNKLLLPHMFAVGFKREKEIADNSRCDKEQH